LRQAWDRRAWSQARPEKVLPQDGAAMVAAWNDDLRQLGFRDPSRRVSLSVPRIGVLDREAAVDLVVSRLGAKRSAWNVADIRGQVEQWIAATGIIAEASVRVELAEGLTARALKACIPLVTRDDVPEHIRALLSTGDRCRGPDHRATGDAGGRARLTAEAAMLDRGDLLVVDEAGMLDQDTARALLEIAHECQARVAFMGDRHQLPAVGRGGVLVARPLPSTKG
jgi:hypothetical protein